MRIRDYRHEILRMLNENGGCFTGFNELLLQGKFHPNTLAKYLKEMRDHNLITINKTNYRNKQKYCIVRVEFENNFNDYIADFKPIEDDLATKNLTWDETMLIIGNYVKLAFRKIKELNIGRFHAEYVSFDKKRLENIEKSKKRISNMIKEKITRLSPGDRERIINSLFDVSADLMTLADYRNMKANSPSY